MMTIGFFSFPLVFGGNRPINLSTRLKGGCVEGVCFDSNRYLGFPINDKCYAFINHPKHNAKFL